MPLLNDDKKKEVKKAIDSGDTGIIKEIKKAKPLLEEPRIPASSAQNNAAAPAAKTPDQKLQDAVSKRDVKGAKDAIALGATIDEADKKQLMAAAKDGCSMNALEIMMAASALEKDEKMEILFSIISNGSPKEKERASKLLGSSEPEVQNGVLEKCMHHEKNYTLAEWAAKAVKKLPKEQRHSLVAACVSSNWLVPRDISLEIALELPLESQRFDVIKTVIGPLHERHLGVNLPLLLRLVDSCKSYHGSSLATALVETARVYFSSIHDFEYEKFNNEFTKKVAIRIGLWDDYVGIRKNAISMMGCLDDNELDEALSSPHSDVRWAVRKMRFKREFF